MPHRWASARTELFDSSATRRVFDLAAKMPDPINLAIGQPDFDVPAAARQAAIDAIQSRKNGYSVTQGMPVLRQKLQARLDAEYGHPDRKVFVSSGTSGALALTMLALVNPGDEVILFDPYFLIYEPLVKFVGGVPVTLDTYPDFRIDLDRVRQAITPRTKLILFNSPSNPTGAVADEATVRGLAELAAERDVALMSDEIYRQFCYGAEYVSPARFNPQTIVLDGFSKTYAMTGWRLGFAHGPAELVDKMLELQQYLYVCAPQPFQWAGAAALDIDMRPRVTEYRGKRDLLLAGLAGYYELETPGGAFYAFVKVPHGSATDFVARALEQQLLLIPGNVFSARDTHFRISYAADERVIARGVEVLRKLARE